MDFLRKIIKRVKEALLLILPVYSLEAASDPDGSMKVIYAGYSKVKLHSFGSYLYSNRPFKIKYLGVSFVFMLGNSRRRSLNTDILLIETSKFWERFLHVQGGCLIPEWVNMEIDISMPMEKMRVGKNSRFSDVERLIRKHNWEYEVSDSTELRKEFYFNMYLPYVKKHDKAAIVGSYNQFIKLLKSGYLLLAKQNGVPLGGALVCCGEGYAVLSWIGVTGGEIKYLKQGVVGALYYFTVLENQRRNYTNYNIGGVGPFINNGLAKYKYGFMGRYKLTDVENRDYLRMNCKAVSGHAKKFLKENPFLCLEDGKLRIRNASSVSCEAS